MGRETKLLLALLATLGGVFLGVLSMKLLVPRPPLGAGPDVHVDTAAAPIELVEPPTLSSAPAGGAAAAGFADARTADHEPAIAAPPRFAEARATAENGDLPPPSPLEPPPSVHAAPEVPPMTVAVDEGRSASPPTPRLLPASPIRRDRSVQPATHEEPVVKRGTPAEPMPGPVADYVTGPGDSWWELAERAYGDGRLYRALFAWNRVIDPRVSLAPGTRLEIPSRERLESAWPKLMPTR